ncbi:Disintegrin and metalloproteinase domain-containing protein 23 [Liparis tanakae]|uniref:Disintegrin and metalloproteinase domain-containing protein 23 n=1 Tax=Liparis tanakae TaxID=230148 RepID=A0A4Z2FR45_9TELE|nr:Disintegrin and metalloproteinase domain-containing protein 23 [Liparis tanakae]
MDDVVNVTNMSSSAPRRGVAYLAGSQAWDKVEGDAVSALLEQQETAAPATENTTHHAVEHVITYPSRLIYYLNEDSESTYHDLDTRVKNQATQGQAVHLAQASFQLEAFGSRFALDLSLNTTQLHGLTRSEEQPPFVEEEEEEEEEEEQLFSELDDLSWLKRRKKRAYKRHKTKQHTRNFAKSVVNFVDAIFKEQLHTRVVLVAVEIWTDKDQIPISVRPLEMLRDFSKYRQQSIKHHADAVHLFSNVTFHYRRSSAAYFGGMCSGSRGVGVNEYGTSWSMAGSLSQSLAQNLGIQWDPASRRKECGCVDSWTGCIMEDTGVQHPRRFSKCSISDYKEFLLKGGGSCLFNRPTKVCNNEATCTCDTTWAGTDCSMPDPPKEPEATQDEGPKGPSATNLIIGSIAGAILVAAIVLGGTGWGFK